VLTTWSASSLSSTRLFGPLNRVVFAIAFAVSLSFAGFAAAGAGQLGPGDDTLNSGEYFDRVTFQGAAGDQVVIELSSTAFDPYLIILDASDQPLLQEDDSPGAG